MATKRQQSQNPGLKKTRQINEILLFAETLDNFYVFFSPFFFVHDGLEKILKLKTSKAKEKIRRFRL
jgi:hypothetical protein